MHAGQLSLDLGAAAGAIHPTFIEVQVRAHVRRTTPTVQVGARPARTRARATDPDTSHDAAKRAALFAMGHASRILAALEQLGSGTAHEVAKHTGLSVVQVDRRRAELVEAGKVRLLMGLDGKPIKRDGFNVMARTEARATKDEE